MRKGMLPFLLSVVKLDIICYEQLLMALKFMLSIAYTAYSYR